ncbi:MAG: hypothetical protein IPK16_14425 [Anaerolineales bacterium]|nr:hypothetical protein [Anaerolineales bacterium]
MAGESADLTVSPSTVANFLAHRQQIVRETAARSLVRTTISHQNADAYRLLAVGLDFTTQALAVAMQLTNTSILDQQLQWANERLLYDGAGAEQLIARFQLLADVVRETLDVHDAQAVNRYVEYLIYREAALAISNYQAARHHSF